MSYALPHDQNTLLVMDMKYGEEKEVIARKVTFHCFKRLYDNDSLWDGENMRGGGGQLPAVSFIFTQW